MTRLVRLGSLALLLFSFGCGKNPKVVSVTPTTICANEDSTLTITGSDLSSSAKVEIGSADSDMGTVPLVAASMVTGSGSTVMAKFAANSLTPHDTPLDLVYTDGGKRVVLPGVITVVPGISIAAVDPATVYNGVDFPTSVYGTGMGAVQTIQISMAGGAGVNLTSVKAIDNNRADAIVPMGTPPGVYDVTVVDQNGCTATLAAALTVTADLTVSVCAIDPAFGYDQVDTDVTITATSDGTAGGAVCGGKMTKFSSTPRAWLNIGGTLVPLDNVAFNSAGSITGTVPKGQTVGGPYDVIVQNPDGSVGLLAGAFKVVDMPVPEVTSLDPPTVPSNYSGTIRILGKNFRAPIKVEYYAQGMAPTAFANPTLVSATEIDFAYPSSALAFPASYIIRVTDLDQGTFGEFSALAVVSSSLNIGAWTDVIASPLVNPTMRHGAAGGQVSNAARYLYVVGGDGGGAAPTRYDSTQLASVDKYGNVGAWIIGHNTLAVARTSLQLIDVPSATGAGGHLYAVGGDAASGVVGTVSRAKILLPSEAPQITKSSVTLGGTLVRGTWYYRVSAVLDATDADNPMGETLTSQEVTAHTVDNSKVAIEWSAVPKAATYRVYRTAMVNGTSKDEVLLADSLTATTFTDDGTATPGTARPFAQGELGVWVDVGALNSPRRSFGLAMAHDPMGDAYLYAVGGDKATGTPAVADLYDTYEYAKLGSDGATLSAWTLDTHKLAAPRTRLQSPVGEHATSPTVGATVAYVYAVGGEIPNASALALANNYEAGTVATGGALTWGSGGSSVKILSGLQSIIESDQLFAMGGEDLAGTPQAVAASAAYGANPAPPAFSNAFSADPAPAHDTSGTESIAALAGLIFESAHYYLIGGSTDGTTALKRVWSQAY